MLSLDQAVLGDTARLDAGDRIRRLLPVPPLPLTALVRMAARLSAAPRATMTLVGRDGEHPLAGYGPADPGAGAVSAGLSLASTIVRLHGGTIRLTANQPTGTVVVVRLPLPAG